MADTEYTPALIPTPTQTTPRVAWGSFLAALALALLLGLSAVDINRHTATPADGAQSIERNGPTLDGRGKWGGYL